MSSAKCARASIACAIGSSDSWLLKTAFRTSLWLLIFNFPSSFDERAASASEAGSARATNIRAVCFSSCRLRSAFS